MVHIKIEVISFVMNHLRCAYSIIVHLYCLFIHLGIAFVCVFEKTAPLVLHICLLSVPSFSHYELGFVFSCITW